MTEENKDLLGRFTDPDIWEEFSEVVKETLEAIENPTEDEVVEALRKGYDAADHFANLAPWIDLVAKNFILPFIGKLLADSIAKWGNVND